MAVVIPWETIITIHITTYLSLIIIIARVFIRLRFVSIYKRTIAKSNNAGTEAGTKQKVIIGSSMYPDDWVALISIIPLLMRLPVIHLSFVYGGTNVPKPELLSEDEIHGRQKGQKLLIASRALLVTFYWLMKWCIAIFYKRLVTLRQPYERAANALLIFLLLSFFPTPLSMLFECRPFHKNWQIIPRPEDACVTGLTTVWIQGMTDIVTNIALIIFPIPIIAKSHLPRTKKFQLIGLFSLGVLVVVITLIRLPVVVLRSANSQFIRTLWTSIEVLASTIVANAPLIKGFISGKMTERRNKSTSNNSAAMTSGLRNGGAGHSGSGGHDAGPSGGSKGGEEIRMTAYGPKKPRKDSLEDSDEEALNPVGSSETASNSVTTLENPPPPGNISGDMSHKISPHDHAF